MPADSALTTTRTYLHIQPADEPLRPTSVERSITRLHRIDDGRLFEAPTLPTYEWLFVATGETGPTGDRSLDWYVGVTDSDRDALERTLTACLPASYDVVETDLCLVDALRLPVETPADTTAADASADGSVDDVTAGPPVETPAHVPADAATDGGADGSATASDAPPLADWDVAGLQFQGVGDRHDDWQLPLTELAAFAGADDGAGDWPVASLLDGLARTDAPTLCQVLVQPTPDWTDQADDRIVKLENGTDTWRGHVAKAVDEFLGGPPAPRDRTTRTPRRDEGSPRRLRTRRDSRRAAGTKATRRPDEPGAGSASTADIPSNARRIAALRDVDTRQSFTVNARAVAFGRDPHDPEATLQLLRDAFDPLAGAHYQVVGTTHAFGTAAANTVLERLLGRRVVTDPEPLHHRLPLTVNASPAIVAGPAAVGGVLFTGGAALASAPRRALETTPPDRTGIDLPPRAILNDYLDAPGMVLGAPKTADRTRLDADLALPPAVQNVHQVILGQTGTGKTALGQGMHLSNHAATDGATIYVDSKGDGGPATYARTHYARHGHLEDVYYFECEEYLPVVPFLSIEPLCAAGIGREQAVETVTEQVVETLAAAAPDADRFYSAASAVAVIRHLVKALFDPVHGDDTIAHGDLMDAAITMRETGNPPPVSDPSLHQKLVGVAAASADSFDNIMAAAIDRLGHATDDGRLAPLFTARPGDESGAGSFDLREKLDEDCVVVFDMSGYGERARTLLTVVVLSQLWRALERRAIDTPDAVDPPLVNCYVEEAADIATSGILDDLLSKGRSFGLAVTLAMQFPEQVRDDHPRVYKELLNDVGTIVTGSVGVDRRLAERMATRSMDADEVAARLRDLKRGEWLVRLAAPFLDRKPQPFYVASTPLPPGHPDGDAPLEETDATLFDTEFHLARQRTRREHGVAVGRPPDGAPEPIAADAPPEATAATLTAATATVPNTERFPDCLRYLDEPPYPLVCTACDTRYAATADGMRRAIACHHCLDDVDREDVPICSLDLQLTAAERAASDYSDAQLRFLAAVYMAHQQRFDPAIEYDVVWDSMTLLEAYVGVDTDAVRELVDDGLLVVDCTRPHKLYTVTPAGRDEIGVGHREGVAYGDRKGDLSESSLHVAMVEVGARLLAQELVGPESPGTEVVRYPAVGDGRLDAAVRDADGEIVATLEAERIHNDRREAIPADFDAMAACEPTEAWWIVKTRADGHALLSALHDAPDGEPRVDRTYSQRMAPREYSLDTPGLTSVFTFEHVRDTLLAADGPGGQAATPAHPP